MGFLHCRYRLVPSLPRVERFWVFYIADTGSYQVCQELKSFGFSTLQIQAPTKFAKSQAFTKFAKG